MTVESAKNKSGPFNVTGTSGTFPRDFLVRSESHLRVIRIRDGVESDLTGGIGHTGIGSPEGTVTIAAGIQPGDKVYLLRAVPKLQRTDYANQGKVRPEVIENDVDLLQMQVQDLAERQERALTLGLSAEVTGPQAMMAALAAPQFAAAAQNAAESARRAAETAAALAPLTPLEYGAIGDGLADDTVAINAAIAASAASGRVLDGLTRTYRVTATIVLPVHRARWRDIVIDGRGITTNGQFTTPVARMDCGEPTMIGSLTANLASDSGSAQIGSGASGNVRAGDWVLVSSQKKMGETEVEGQATRHSRATELIRVRSVTEAGLVSFWSKTKDSYATADSARLLKVQTAGGVHFQRVGFIGADCGFEIYDGFESYYRGCFARNQTARGFNEDRCYRTDGDDWTFTSIASEPAFASAPYGLCFTACQDCSYGDVSGDRIRHLTTTGSNSASRGRMVSRGCTLGDVYCTNAFSSVVDQHPGGGFLQVGNVYAQFAENASHFVACQFQGAGGSVQAIDANNGQGFLFDSYGFNEQDFTPYVSVGFLHNNTAAYGAVASNYTNRYGTGIAQKIGFNINAIDVFCGVGISINPNSGDVDASIGGGRIATNTALGLGRCFDGGAGAGVPRIRVVNTDCRAVSGARLAQLLSGELTVIGGALTGVGGSAELRITAADMRIVATAETNITDVAASGGTIRRAALA